MSKLKYNQIQTLSDFTMYKVKSEMITNNFIAASDWHLVDVQEDPFWKLRYTDNAPGKYVPKLKCYCGKTLKYQYVLESRNGKQLYLGKEHFMQHAGIPQKIANQIHERVNDIMIFRDEILVKYDRGERFPLKEYRILDRSGMIFEFGEDFRYKLRRFRDANLPLFHVDENRLMSKYRQIREANYALQRVLNREKFEDNHFLFRRMLEKYIDDVKIKNLKDDTEWLKSVLNDCRLVEENMESMLSISTNMTKEILKADYIKPINVRLTSLSMDGIFKIRFERILNSTKKSIYEKNEVDILLKKEEEKIVELNALQVQLYGKNAVQDYRDMKENRSIEEVIDSISEIKKKYEEYEKIKHKYIHLINTYINFYPVLINRLNEISDKEIMLSNNIESEYTKVLEEYKKLPRLNEGENKIVRYFMFRHKVNIPGKGIKQGYSLSAIPIEKFKEVKSKDIQKLLLEYLILRVAIVEEIIEFKNKELQDKYTKAKNIISRDGKYKPDKIMESYDIELLISLLIDDKYSKYDNITLNKKVELLKQKLDKIIKESGKRTIVEHILNGLISSYHGELSSSNDISNIVDSIIREGNEVSYNVASLSQWEQDFIDFLYELNYYYYGDKLSKDRKTANVKVLNKNLMFLRFINTKMRPIIEQINLSEQLREIYGSNLVEKVDTINKLSKVAKIKNKDIKAKEKYKSVLKISSKQLDSIIKVYRKCFNKKGSGGKLKKLERGINSLEIRDSLKKEIIFFEKNKENILKDIRS
ncbi:hypothetical protein [Ligilactobacillus salivarius]|uniref:Uncharacterized protein n=1 Tax=Ligilactobacillus salivarius TaxID=1624 RepID=A0AAW6Q4S9_9LACO|nr:hypothetical protein [Ligilactobacillus salivarius]MBZ4025102.1 hypothetical protein [Ligilactobacillus salivarius]MDF4187012.1 hypothetical protein [Ligilactobacillus salivarius]